MNGLNTDLATQMKMLESIVKQNKIIHEVLKMVGELQLPAHYIGAGCIAQSVWNYQCGYDLMYGISDIDIAYFDCADLSYQAENAVVDKITQAVNTCGIKLDIKNQARVHLWYKEHFGYDISPYNSIEAAINTWPTTATSVGVRQENGQFKIYAPFGLNDMFGMLIRANKAQITPEIYKQKHEKWLAKWPDLVIVPW